MPNHVPCMLTIKGNSEALQKFREFARGPNPVFAESEHDKAERIFRNKRDGKPEDFVPPPVVDDFQCNNFAPVPAHVLASGYGSKGSLGYQWCVDNWSTKWGCYDITLAHVSGDTPRAFLVYCFVCAWCPPLKVLDVAAKKFPKLRFRLEYQEPYDNSAHRMSWKKGTRVAPLKVEN